MAKRLLSHAIMLGIFIIVLAHQTSFASDFRFSPRPNTAHLVQWRTWGKEALGEARNRNRPILLSLSAVWCHWCHVMDETTYSDEAVIRYINDHFIPIRVDADLRPDIDGLYNQGGWPSTVFLTPEGEVISGGNYIPVDAMRTRMEQVVEVFTNDKGRISKRIEAFRERRSSPVFSEGEFRSADVIDNIIQKTKNSFDEEHGGFGSGQKFPSPPTLDLLLSIFVKTNDREVKKVMTATLDHMAAGEIHDRVEGGFFRYATEPDWSKPHYEKMLDVNAGLIRNYADAGRVFGREDYRRIADQTIRYVRASLFDRRSGAFYGSQDADEEYYRRHDRKGLKIPGIDRTVYADSSALMITSLAAASSSTGNGDYLAMAKQGADFLLDRLYSVDQGVFHSYHDGHRALSGQLLDNALVGSALLDLYELTAEKRYRAIATALGVLILRKFFDPKAGAFKPNLGTTGAEPVTAGIMADVSRPAANYRALQFLGRLHHLNRDKEMKLVVEKVAAIFSGEYKRYPPYSALYGNAVLWVNEDIPEITIMAEKPHFGPYLRALQGVFFPLKTVRYLSLSDDEQEIKALGYPMQEAAYVCRGKRCSAPVRKPGRLKDELGLVVRQGGVP